MTVLSGVPNSVTPSPPSDLPLPHPAKNAAAQNKANAPFFIKNPRKK